LSVVTWESVPIAFAIEGTHHSWARVWPSVSWSDSNCRACHVKFEIKWSGTACSIRLHSTWYTLYTIPSRSRHVDASKL
jgi:hypothetical protein